MSTSKKNDITTEKKILEYAEKEFLEKGYDRAKLSTIAKNAKVNHAMVHYYFDTKENLFGIVFRNKIELLANKLVESFDSQLDFVNQLDHAIEEHFAFVRDNPNITLFILREIATDMGQMKRIHQLIKPKIDKLLASLQRAIDVELQKGTIKAIDANDLFLHIISLNASSIVVATILNKTEKDITEEEVFDFLEHRKEQIKRFVIENITKSN